MCVYTCLLLLSWFSESDPGISHEEVKKWAQACPMKNNMDTGIPKDSALLQQNH